MPECSLIPISYPLFPYCMASEKFAKNQPYNRFYPKKPAGMHWSGCNDAVPWLNEAKTRIFQPTANF